MTAIQRINEENVKKIDQKKDYLQYLKTPQRIDKEAKMQMGKKQTDEKVLIFIEEKLDILPTPTPKTLTEKKETNWLESVSIFDRWKWIFLGNR